MREREREISFSACSLTPRSNQSPLVSKTREWNSTVRVAFRCRPGRREMLRDTLLTVPGGVAGRYSHSAADERAAGSRAQGHPGPPGGPSESARDRRADAASSSQQPQDETQFSRLALRRGLRYMRGEGGEGGGEGRKRGRKRKRGDEEGSSPRLDANTKVSTP